MLNYPEKEIHLFDLCKKLFKKWKWMALVLIVGLFVGAGITICLGKATVTITNDNGVTAIEESLSEEKRNSVEKNAVLYKDLLKTRQKYQDEVDKYTKTEIKDEEGQSLTLYYLIGSDEKTRGLVPSLETICYDDEMLKELKIMLKDEEATPDTVEEIINVTLEKRKHKFINDTSSDLMMVEIYGKDVEMCNSIKNIIEEKISKETKKIQAKYPEFVVDKFFEKELKCILGINQDKYFDYLERIRSINDCLQSMKGNMDEKETEYFKALIDNNELNQENTLEDTKAASVFSKKLLAEYMILFGIGFVCLYIIFFIIRYLITDHLHTTETLKQQMGLNVLCKVKGGDCAIAYEEIMYDLNSTSGDKIGIMTSSNDKALDKMIATLKKIDKDNVIIPLNAHPGTEEDFASLHQVEKIILIEKEESSSVKDIVDVVNYHRNKGIVIENVIMAE